MTLLKPIVPDTVIRFRGQQVPHIPPSASDTMAIPIVHDWGPLASDVPGSSGRDGGFQEVQSFAEFVSLFGDSDTPGRTAVAGGFAGSGLPGATGAGAVIVSRVAGSAVAAATLTLQDRAAANAVTVKGRYKGTRGNNIAITVDVDPDDATRDRLQVLYQGAVRETFRYAQTDVAGLVDSVNRRSNLIRMVDVETAAARLAAVSSAALTGGNDGLTLLTADHVAALDALDFAPFSVLAPYDVTDAGVQAAYKSWAQAQDAANRPVRVVLGGAADDTIDTALTRALALNDPHVLTVGVGTWHDDLLDKDLSTSQLAPRIGGTLVAKGQAHSLTHAKLGGIHAVGNTAPAADEIETAVQNGIVVFMQTSSPIAHIQIAKGVTTFTTSTDPDRPLAVFGDARLVGVMDAYVRDMKQWGDDIVIGELPVNDDTRQAVYAEAKRLQDILLRQGLILPGDGVTVPKPFVIVVDTSADPEYLDAIPYQFGWQFAHTADYILGEGTVR